MTTSSAFPPPLPSVRSPFGRFAPVVVAAAVFLSWGCGGSDGATDPVGSGLPASLELLSPGATGPAIPGGPFPEAVRFRLTDAAGRPLGDRPLTVEIVEGAGWVPNLGPRTGPDGVVAIPWYAGPDPAGGVQRLRVRSGSLEAEAVGSAIPAAPGVVHLGHRGFVEYSAGTLPLLITASHGGTMLPADIPDRTGDGIVVVRDAATDSLALFMADALEALTGERPHLVRVHLHRRKLDANRDLPEAAQGQADAVRGWREFHAWTEAAMAAVRAQHPRGFYVDVHGHGHDIQRLELGYLLSSADLAQEDAVLDTPALVAKSSLREMAGWTGVPHHALVRGPASLGALYESEGYPAVPSPSDPHPAGAPYFTGGYNTRRYGCSEGGTICGFQLEANRIGVRDSPAALQAFAAASARVLAQFMALHLGAPD